MNAEWLEKEVPRNGPEWKLVIRWSHFIAKKRQGLDSSQRHTWNKVVVGAAMQQLVEHSKKGTISAYTQNFSYEGTWQLLKEWWPEFRELERPLIAEIVLTR